MNRYEWRGSAAKLSLHADMGLGDLTFTGDGDLSGWPTGAAGRPFVVTIGRGRSDEEKILCGSQIGGVFAVATRGKDGGTAKTHAAGATVEHSIAADKLDDWDDHVYTVARDDHLQYLRTDGTRPPTGVTAMTGTPVPVAGTNQPGTANLFARSDHVHSIADGTVTSAKLAPNDVLPAGMLVDFAGAAAPAGWLLCDGSPVSRTTYAALYAALGATYGAGDGVNTFNLPDFRGRTAVMPDAGAGRVAANNTLAASDGTETHAIAAAELPAHTHGVGTLATISAGSHAHQPSDGSYNFAINKAGVSNTPHSTAGADSTTGLTYTGTTTFDGVHTHTISGATASVGSGTPVSVMQPYLVVNKIIKT